MPNIKSAKKRLRTSERQYLENQPVRTRVRTARRKFMEAAAESDKDVMDKAFRAYCSSLDKAVKKGLVKKNTAIRSKTRAANKIRTVA